MKLGSKICELRKNANISQEQLAEKLNVTRQTISNWELGQTAPDIFQAKEISKIFGISLDELAENDMKDILVEKISNAERMANTTIKTLKFLCIIVICFLIIIISMNTTLLIKNKREDIDKQFQEQAYREDIANLETRRFNILVDDEEYNYIIQYSKDYKLFGNCISLISEHSRESQENWNTYFNYICERYENCGDARDLIKDVQQYFKNKGATWEEIL